MSLKNLARRLFLRALSPAPTRRHQRPVGRPVEQLEDRVVPSLVNYYQGEGNALDSQGTNHGTLNNGATFTAGLIGDAFRFDGVNDSVSVARQVQNDFSLATWVRTTATAPGTNFYEGQPLVTAEFAGVTNDFGTTLLNGKFAFGVGNPDQTLVSTTAVNDGAWHHVAATRQGGTIRVYVDGTLEGTLAGANAGALTASGTVTIGGDPVNNRYFAGTLDDVRVYNHALTAAEVSNLGQASIGAAIDDAGNRLMFFNPTTGTQTGGVSIPGGQLLETVLDPQGKFAYVADFNGGVRIVDLATQALATGISAIPVPNAEDMVITADGKYLLVVDGSNVRPITVIDTATRAVVSALDEGIHHIGIDVTATGDVLSSSGGLSRRYTLSPAGVLTFTGQTVAGAGLNVTAAPNGLTAVQTDVFGGFSSFVIAGMSSVTTLTTGGLGRALSAAFSPDGTRLYVRTPNNLLGYAYNPATGAIGGQFFNVGGFPTATALFGVDYLDVTPTRVYTPIAGGVGAFDALTGASLATMPVQNSVFVGVDTVLGVVAPAVPPPPPNDYGDALASFGVAQHTAIGVRLGANRDTELSSNFSPLANGDDVSGFVDDEDGVTIPTLLAPNQPATVNFSVQNVSGTAYLQGWIDWNQDGVFGTGEQIITNAPVTASGTIPVTFTVPGTASVGSHLARYRVSTTPNLGPTGAAGDGEVEDAVAFIPAPSTVYVSPTFSTPGAVVDGDLTAAGVQPATVGYNAFATIADAMAGVNPGGSGVMILNTAVYSEPVVVDTYLVELRSYGATVDGLTTPVGFTPGLRGTFNSGGTFEFNYGAIIYGDVTLNVAGGVSFGGDLSYSFFSGEPANLTIDSAGTTTFGGAVYLTSLTTDAPGITVIAGGSVSTTGDQFYGDPVTLTRNTSITSYGGNVTFASTVDDSLVLRYSQSTPAYNFIDISATGTPGPASDDETMSDVPVGFTFDYFGTPTDLLSICTNGFINLANSPDVFVGSNPFPDYFTGANVAGWWADLNPADGGEIRYETIGAPGSRVFIVQWTGVEHYGNPGFPVTFQIQLHEGSNAIEVHLPDANSDGQLHTVGVQDHASTTGITAFSNFTPLPANTAFRFAPAVVPADSALSVSAPGTTTFGGAVGGLMPLGSLTTHANDFDTAGTTILAAGSIRTTGAQTFHEPVLVTGDTSLTSAGGEKVTFTDALDGPAGLGVNTTGTVRFSAAVGGTTPLAYLTTDAGGATVVDGGSITTTGAQVYDDQFNLGAPTTVTSTAGAVTFNGPVDTGHTPVEQITNGSFETGDFTGWTAQDLTTSLYPLSVVGAGVNANPNLFYFDSAPTDGDFAAFNAYDTGSDPGTIRLSQQVTIPADAFQAVLTFDIQGEWNNFNSFFQTLDQVLVVTIETPGGTVLLSTPVIEPIFASGGIGIPYTQARVDLSAFIGQTIVVCIDQVVPPDLFPEAQVQIDNVRLLADLPAAPRSLTVNSGAATAFNAAVGGARLLDTLTVTAGGNLTVGAAVTTTGATTLNFGQDNAGRTAVLNGGITAATATVTGGGGADQISVSATASGPVLTLNAAGGGDTYSVAAGAAHLGTVAIADAGTSGTDAAFVIGTAAGDTFNVNNPASGARTVTVTGGGSATVWYSTPVTLEQLTLSGGAGGDTYNVSYANPLLPGSALPNQWVKVNAGGGSDAANLFGTSNPDAININNTTARRVILGAGNLDYTTALETLNVFGGDEVGPTGDTITVTPDSPTAITISGGNPTQPSSPGDTLVLNALGLVGAAITPNPPIPNGQVASSNKATVAWTGIETFPVPLGMGGTFDFDAARDTQTQPGWFSVLPSDTLVGGAYSFANAGWVSSPQAYDRDGTNGYFPPAGPLSKLLRDGAWGGQGGGGQRDFRVSVAPNQPIQVTAILGDTATINDSVDVLVSSDGVNFVLLNPAPDTFQNSLDKGYKFVSYAGEYTPTSGSLTVRIRDNAGNYYWTIAGLDVRPLGLRAALAVSGPTSAPADGTTVSTYTLTGAANALVTVAVSRGVITTTDAAPSVAGFQVLTNGSGTATFDVRSPVSTATTTSAVTAAEVTGASASAPFSVTYTGTGGGGGTAPVRFDFNGASNDTAAGFVGVRGNQTFTTAKGYGWAASQAEFERTTASVLAKGVTATQAPLYRDGMWGYGTGTFRVAVTPNAATMAARVYVGDSYTNWANIVLSVEGGTPLALNTSATPFGAYVLTGSDANGDGRWDISISSSYVWVVNGIDVTSGGVGGLPALPVSADPSAAPVLEGGVVAGGQLAPVVAAAIDRLAAAQQLSAAQVAQLRAVRFEVGDLGDGHLGEHLGGLIRLDADAAGRGWFVDPTPSDDAEFTPTSATQGVGGRGVDLLTVVMHELSHELGAIDLGAVFAPDSLMAEDLGAGVRRLPNGGTWALSAGVNRTDPHLWVEDADQVAEDLSDDLPAAVTHEKESWTDVPAVAAVSAGTGRVWSATPVLLPDWFGEDLLTPLGSTE